VTPAREGVDLAAVGALGEYVSDCRWSAEAGVVRGLDGAEYPEIATAVRDADAEWIAFFDPPTVRGLLDQLLQLGKDLGQYRAYATRLERQLAEAERIIRDLTAARLADAAKWDHAGRDMP
jgi:hypothetical protein